MQLNKGILNRRDPERQSRNQRQEGLTAEYAKYAENRLLPGSPSAYSAYSAVYLFPEDSSPPANNLDYCSAMDPERQSRNQRREGITAEYAKYAEHRLPPGSPSAYSAYSAVYLFPEDSSPPANNLAYCSAETDHSRPLENMSLNGDYFERHLPCSFLCVHRVSAVLWPTLQLHRYG